MPILRLKEELAKTIAGVVKAPCPVEEVLSDLSAPPNQALGHVAFPCFKLSKALRKGPPQIAKELSESLGSQNILAEPTGPYVNIRWKGTDLYDEVISEILGKRTAYGRDELGLGKTIALEYCSPNIAKRLAFQHIRSTLIGNTLANIYDALGYKTARINFVGDWGTQFARLLAAVEIWGDFNLFIKSSPSEYPKLMDLLFDLYVKFHQELESNPKLADEGARWLSQLEKGEKRAVDAWRAIREISVWTMELTLKRLQVKFTQVDGESQYIAKMEPMLKLVKEKAEARVSEGAWVVDVEGLSVPALIQKRDGTTLYLTRDLAAAVDRWDRFKFEKSFYVVSEQQRLHFQMVFGILKKMGYDFSDRLEHLSFGTVLFGAEKMSTREGRVIFLDVLLNEATDRALKQCTQKNPDLLNKDEVAEQVGIGAVIFGSLYSNRQRDLEFNWDQVLSLEGETGPYVQYCAVRCRSILNRAQLSLENILYESPNGYAFSPEEEALLLELGKFRMVLREAARDNEPYHIPRYLIDVSKQFSRFYYGHPVLTGTDERTKAVRLKLVAATLHVVQNGLNLMGISCPNEM